MIIGSWNLEIVDHLPSTSDLLRERAAAGAKPGIAVMARRQTKGRGSHGRDWLSPAGNLYLSVLLRPKGRVRDSGLWSLLAAVALADTVETLLPDASLLRLKWPNDVLLDGIKLAGILLDSTADSTGRFTSLVIGFGLNLATAPMLTGRLAACVADVAPAPRPDAVAPVLLERLDHWCAIQAEEGFAPIRAAWLARAQRIGAPITVHQGARDLGGRFAGLGEDGSLLLDTDGHRQAFAAGEVRLQAGA